MLFAKRGLFWRIYEKKGQKFQKKRAREAARERSALSRMFMCYCALGFCNYYYTRYIL